MMFSTAALLGFVTAAPTSVAHAQDTSDEPLERSPFEVPAADESPDNGKRKRVIQTLQNKTFLKIGRYEASPHLGFVTNDPFVSRYLFGGSIGYHVTEVFSVDLSGSFSPDLGDADLKPVADQLINENGVNPDISRLLYNVAGTFQFAPLHGKFAVGKGRIIGFDIYTLFGTGIAGTKDDLELAGLEDDPAATDTELEIHPTINYGGGIRVLLSDSFGLRLQGQGLSYLEGLESIDLEMKNYFTLLAGVSFFFPGGQ